MYEYVFVAISLFTILNEVIYDRSEDIRKAAEAPKLINKKTSPKYTGT